MAYYIELLCPIAYMAPPFRSNGFLIKAMAPPEIIITDIYRLVILFVFVMTNF